MKNAKLRSLGFLLRSVFARSPGGVLLFCANFVLLGATPVAELLLSRSLINALLAGDKKGAIIAAVSMLCVKLVSSLFISRIERAQKNLYAGTQLEMEEKLCLKAARLSYEKLEDAAFQDEIELAKVGVSWYSGGVAGLMNMLSELAVSLILCAAMIVIFSRSSGLMMLCVFALAALCLLVSALAQRRDSRFRKELLGVNRRLSYYLNMFKKDELAQDVRMFSGTELIHERADDFLNREWKITQKMTKLGNKLWIWTDVVKYAGQCALYLFFAAKVVGGEMDIGSFTMYVGAGMTLYSKLSAVAAKIIEAHRALAYFEKYASFMLFPEEVKTGDAAVTGPEYVWELEDVSYRYPGAAEDALHGLSMAIRSGEKISIIGPNGAGKSTLIKLLCRFYEPSAGRILLNGRDIREYDPDAYRAAISSVFQDYVLMAFSLRENVSVCEREEGKTAEALRKTGLYERVSALPNGLDTPIGRQFDESGVLFSGGERQRIAIARAIYKDAPLVLFDEPTASLDPVTENEIFRLFGEAAEGKTVVYISHRMASCLMCDKIYLMENGCLRACGSHAELLAQDGLYRRMWNAQAKYYDEGLINAVID